MPDQSGRTAIVTGANSGLGFETCLMLAKKRANVDLACRNTSRAEEAMRLIYRACPDAKLSAIGLDLADLDSIAICAKNFHERHNRLDLLINNAGVMIPPLSRTKEGFELQFGTNHLGHFALTGRLLPMMLKTKGSRVMSVCSIAAKIGNLDLDDLN